MSFPFCRFKKKSLTIVCELYPIVVMDILEEIKNKKLFQCQIREEGKNKTEEKILYSHTEAIDCLTKLSKTLLASGSYDTTIKIWNLLNGRCLHSLRGHLSLIFTVIKVDNSQIASGGVDTTIRIWNYHNGKHIKTLTNNDQIFCLTKISSTQIASGGRLKKIKIWDISNGNCLKTYSEDCNKFYSIKLVKINKAQFVSVSWGKTILLWTIEKNYYEQLLNQSFKGDKCIIRINKSQIAIGNRKNVQLLQMRTIQVYRGYVKAYQKMPFTGTVFQNSF